MVEEPRPNDSILRYSCHLLSFSFIRFRISPRIDHVPSSFISMALPNVNVEKASLTEKRVRVIVIPATQTSLATVFVVATVLSQYVNFSSWMLSVQDWLVLGALIFTWGYAAGNIPCTCSDVYPCNVVFTVVMF
jgi:hypothetical protein